MRHNACVTPLFINRHNGTTALLKVREFDEFTINELTISESSFRLDDLGGIERLRL